MDKAGPVPKHCSLGFGPDPAELRFSAGEWRRYTKPGCYRDRRSTVSASRWMALEASFHALHDAQCSFNSLGDPSSMEARGNGGIQIQGFLKLKEAGAEEEKS